MVKPPYVFSRAHSMKEAKDNLRAFKIGGTKWKAVNARIIKERSPFTGRWTGAYLIVGQRVKRKPKKVKKRVKISIQRKRR